MSVIPWPLEPVRGGGRRSTGVLKHAMIEHMPSADDTAGLAAALIQSRQTILPKRLGSPGPNVPELAAILQAAAHAPDHGQLTPWRFVLVPDTSRTLLADVFAEALLERDPGAALNRWSRRAKRPTVPPCCCWPLWMASGAMQTLSWPSAWCRPVAPFKTCCSWPLPRGTGRR